MEHAKLHLWKQVLTNASHHLRLKARKGTQTKLKVSEGDTQIQQILNMGWTTSKLNTALLSFVTIALNLCRRETSQMQHLWKAASARAVEQLSGLRYRWGLIRYLRQSQLIVVPTEMRCRISTDDISSSHGENICHVLLGAKLRSPSQALN